MDRRSAVTVGKNGEAVGPEGVRELLALPLKCEDASANLSLRIGLTAPSVSLCLPPQLIRSSRSTHS